jgi:hypothetical protein
MDEDYKFTKITMFYFGKNKTYNKWITNDDNNNKDDEKEYDNNNKREIKSTTVTKSKKCIKENQKMKDK